MFSISQNKVWRDEADGVLRCSGCGFEHEGGPLCSNCGEQVDDDDEYDLDADDNATLELTSMGFDMDAESEDEVFNMHNYHQFQQHLSSYADVAHSRRAAANISQSQFVLNQDFEIGTNADYDTEASEISASSDSSEFETDGDDDSSLQDFIAPDDDNAEYEASSNRSANLGQEYQPSRIRQRNIASISDDESDEGGAISNRRQRNLRNCPYISNIQSPSPAPSFMTVTDASSDDSEIGDHEDTNKPWGPTRWNSLSNWHENDKESSHLSSRNVSGYAPGSDDESDTNTEIVDKKMSDDDDQSNNGSQAEDYDRSQLSKHPTLDRHSSLFYGFSESCNSQSTDEDGDVDMNTSLDFASNSQLGGEFSPNSWELNSIDDRSNNSDSSESEDQTVRMRVWQKSPIYSNNGPIYSQESPDTSGTHRKRSTQNSTTIHATEAGPVVNDTMNRRPKAWQLMKMHLNQRENGMHQSTSRIQDANSVSTDDNIDSTNSSAENIGLVNVINELSEDSDESIRPATRRHYSYLNSSLYASRHHPRNAIVSGTNNQTFRNRFSDEMHSNTADSEHYWPRLRSRRLSAYRIAHSYGYDNSLCPVPLVPHNTIPLCSSMRYRRH